MTSSRQQGPFRPAWLTWIWCALLFLAVAGLSSRSLFSRAILLAFGLALALIEARTRRPARSYLRLALGSALLFTLLVVNVASWSGDLLLSTIMWVGVTTLGVIWTVYYERTEPLA